MNRTTWTIRKAIIVLTITLLGGMSLLLIAIAAMWVM